MRIYFYLTFLLSVFTSSIFAAGSNCSDPIIINADCPVVSLTNQSSIGMGNDYNSWYYSSYPGEDMVYQVNYPTGATNLLLEISGLNYSSRITTGTTCSFNSSTYYTNYNLSYYSANSINIPLPVGNVIYLVIDSYYNNISFNMSVGLVTRGSYLNIPSTRGTLKFSTSTCASPAFLPYLDIYKDGSQGIVPMPFSSYGNSQELCFKLYLENKTGKEGPKMVSFTYTGFNNISSVSNSIGGKYAAGSWTPTISGNKITYTFNNTTDASRGDHNETFPQSCMEYEFCMNARTNSTNPNTLEIGIWVTGDGKYPGYSGYSYSGCAPGSFTNLYGVTGIGAAGAAGFGIGIGSKGLPVDFINVWQKNNTIYWTTTNEKKLSHYLIEASNDGFHFENIYKVMANNNASFINNYSSSIPNLFLKYRYFKIISVDDDGTEKHSRIIFNSNEAGAEIIYNQSSDNLNIVSHEVIEEIVILNSSGQKIYSTQMGTNNNNATIDLQFLKSGVYIVETMTSSGIYYSKILK